MPFLQKDTLRVSRGYISSQCRLRSTQWLPARGIYGCSQFWKPARSEFPCHSNADTLAKREAKDAAAIKGLQAEMQATQEMVVTVRGEGEQGRQA